MTNFIISYFPVSSGTWGVSSFFENYEALRAFRSSWYPNKEFIRYIARFILCWDFLTSNYLLSRYDCLSMLINEI